MSPAAVKLKSSAARRLLQPGRCFAVLAICRSTRHGCRLHCAALTPVGQCRCGSLRAHWPDGCRAASSGQPPSFKPFRLFDEKRAALTFPSLLTTTSFFEGAAA
jgi:hypothetical protein